MLSVVNPALLSRLRILGLFLDRGCIYASVRIGRRICWQGARHVSADSQELAHLEAILREAPPARSVRVAISPTHAPMRHLEGLPPLSRRKELQQLVRANGSRFFLLRGGQPVPSEVVRMPNGTEWAAAASSSMIAQIASCCAAQGRRLELVAPAVAAEAANSRVGSIAVEIGGQPWIARVARRRIVNLERAPSSSTHGNAEASIEASSLDKARVASGATILRRSTPFVIAAPRRRAPGNGGSARRSLSLALAAAIAIAAFLFLPGMHALTRAKEWEQASPWAVATRAQAARMTARLDSLRLVTDRIGRFQESRWSMTRQLGSITEALPESTAILTLRLDTLGGAITTLATDGPAVLPALGKVPGLARVRVSGAVTREQVAGVELDRIALNFSIVGRGGR